MRRAGTFLYIDDDAALARLVERSLSKRGHTVILASDAETGLRLLGEHRIEVVGLDHNLPTGTGMDFLAALKSVPDAPTVVYVTASTELDTALSAMRGGALDFVPKTVGEDFQVILAAALEGALEITRLRAARDAAERDIHEARERAEVLLREVNHRVANSLAIVSSLVGLQAKAVEDDVARTALEETQARIFAIAGVHKSLYTSGDVRFVELSEYLSSLLDHIGSGSAVRIAKALEPVQVDTDSAVSLGIVATELVTNAIKYGYPGEAKGEVRVALYETADGLIEMRVADDGPGWTGTGKPQGSGLGTKIINTISRGLGATLTYFADGGTTAVVSFSKKPVTDA